jgi:predicted Rdx family selenoprotein
MIGEWALRAAKVKENVVLKVQCRLSFMETTSGTGGRFNFQHDQVSLRQFYQEVPSPCTRSSLATATRDPNQFVAGENQKDIEV